MKRLQKNLLKLSIIAIIIITLSIIVIPFFITHKIIEVIGNHEPIYIDGNTAFINISSNEGWEGNGTHENPYIIKNYIIKDSPTHGIEIRNTDVYFIINNVTINGGRESWDFENGFDLYNVRNGVLKNNIVIAKDHGYFLENSHNITLIENTAKKIMYDGFYLENCDNNNLTRNIVRDGEYFSSGFTLENSDNNILMENTVIKIDDNGFELERSNRNILIRNNIKGGHEGIRIMLYSNYNNISSNIIKEVYEGISIHSGAYNTVTGNIIKDVNVGIYLSSSDYNIVTGNSITQFTSECIDESVFSEGDIISNNLCRSIWVDVGNGFLIALIVIVILIIAFVIYRAKPILKIKNRKDRRKGEHVLKAEKFETLLRDSKRLINQGNQSFSKKKYEIAIEKWQESVNKYIIASKNSPSSLEKSGFKDNIKFLRKNICKAYLERGKTHNLIAGNAHKKEDIQKSKKEWNSAINDFQTAADLIKSEKLEMSYSLIENKINSIRLNLKQIEIERICVEADKNIEQAQSLQNKDLIQATKLTQDSFIQYYEAKKKAEKNPEFQELINIILKKLENTRQFQLELQDKMEDLIGITPLKTNVFIDDTQEMEQDKIKTIIKTEERERELFIVREYEFIGGQIRFKIAIINNTRSPLTNFKISFSLPDALKWIIHEPDYERRGDTLLISKLGVNEKKAISLYLEPINCMESPINATISFFDVRDKPRALTMKPKMISITCPIFFTEDDANLARVKSLRRKFNHHDKKIFPLIKSEESLSIFSSILSVLNKFDIKLTFKHFSEEDRFGEAWFYGITKIKKNQIVIYVLLDGTDKKVEIEVSGNDEPQITAFLAEIGDRTRKQLIQNKIIDIEDDFYDMRVSILSKLCPYCYTSISGDQVQKFIDGGLIQCKNCNVELKINEK